MTSRRDFLFIGATGLALSGCSLLGSKAELPKLPVDVSVNLPPEIKTIIDDATAAVSKVESLGGSVSSAVTGLIDTAKADIAKLKGGVSGIDTKTIVHGLVSTLGTVAGFLPPPYGTIALAIETLLPIMGGAIGLRMAARRPTGMSPAQARALLRS